MSAAIYPNTKFQWKNLRHFSWTAYQQRFFRNIVMGPLQLSRIFLWERLSLSLDLMHLLLQKSILNCVAISMFWILFPSLQISISAKYISFAIDYDFDRNTFLVYVYKQLITPFINKSNEFCLAAYSFYIHTVTMLSQKCSKPSNCNI